MGNVVILQVKDGIGVYRNAEFWSSDGTTSGNLIPVSILSDTSGNVMLPASQTDITTLQQSLTNNLQNVIISSGNIRISNLPTTQQISGNTAITNFPAIQTIVGNVNVKTGSVTITNFPATQNVNISAPVSIANFPTQQKIVGLTPFEAITTIVRTSSNLSYTSGQLINNSNVGMTSLPVISTGLGSNTRVTINSVVVLSNNGAAASPANFAVHLFPTQAPSGQNLNDGNLFSPDSNVFIATGVGLIGSVNDKFSNIGSNSYMIGTNSYGYRLTNLSTQAQTDSAGNLYAAVILENPYDAVAGETITVKVTGKY